VLMEFRQGDLFETEGYLSSSGLRQSKLKVLEDVNLIHYYHID